MDFMTDEFRDKIIISQELADWAAKALERIRRDGDIPDFIVGRPDADNESLEDDGRTLILPIKYHRKVYCVLNELGGATLMMADEY